MDTTADIRARMLNLWKRVDEGKISATELRMQIGLARVILDTLKVEMAAAHLNQSTISAIPVRPPLPLKVIPSKRN